MIVYVRWRTPKSLDPRYIERHENLSRWHVAVFDMATDRCSITLCGEDPYGEHRREHVHAFAQFHPPDGGVCGNCLASRGDEIGALVMKNVRYFNDAET